MLQSRLGWAAVGKLMPRWSENSKIREIKIVYSCNEFRSNAEGIYTYKQWDDNRAGLALITLSTKGGTSEYGMSVTINMT